VAKVKDVRPSAENSHLTSADEVEMSDYTASPRRHQARPSPASATRPQRDPKQTVCAQDVCAPGRWGIVSARTVGEYVKALFLSALIGLALTVWLAPTSAADATANLRSQIDATRGECSPLQSDPTLDGVAQRANDETRAYIEHTARFEPFEDALPALRDIGYKAGKAKLIPGYGDIEDKAIRGVLVQGWETIPDCTYTKYGVNVLDNPEGMHGGYVLAALILAGD
jgi:hypothetical protein